MDLLAFLCLYRDILNVKWQLYSCSRLMKKAQCKRVKTKSPLLIFRHIGNGDMLATVAKIRPRRRRFLTSVADEGLHISSEGGYTDCFSISDGGFGPVLMCRSVLVYPQQIVSITIRCEPLFSPVLLFPPFFLHYSFSCPFFSAIPPFTFLSSLRFTFTMFYEQRFSQVIVVISLISTNRL